MGDARILLERTFHLFPSNEFSNLLGQFQKFLKVDMPIGKAVGTALIEEVNVLDEQTEEGDDDLLPAAVSSE